MRSSVTRLLPALSLAALVPLTAFAEPCFKACGTYEYLQIRDGEPSAPGARPRIAEISCTIQGDGSQWNNLQRVSFQGMPGHPAGIMFRDKHPGHACKAFVNWIGSGETLALKTCTDGGSFVLQKPASGGNPGELLIFKKL